MDLNNLPRRWRMVAIEAVLEHCLKTTHGPATPTETLSALPGADVAEAAYTVIKKREQEIDKLTSLVEVYGQDAEMATRRWIVAVDQVLDNSVAWEDFGGGARVGWIAVTAADAAPRWRHVMNAIGVEEGDARDLAREFYSVQGDYDEEELVVVIPGIARPLKPAENDPGQRGSLLWDHTLNSMKKAVQYHLREISNTNGVSCRFDNLDNPISNDAALAQSLITHWIEWWDYNQKGWRYTYLFLKTDAEARSIVSSFSVADYSDCHHIAEVKVVSGRFGTYYRTGAADTPKVVKHLRPLDEHISLLAIDGTHIVTLSYYGPGQ